MTSPFVRRRRLGAEIRALREEHGLTAEELARRLHQSRMKITRIENAQVRPNLVDVMDILDLLGVSGERRTQIIRIARDGAARGWWDDYGDAMGPRQRLFADVESGVASIREYEPALVPGLLQTREYTRELVEYSGKDHTARQVAKYVAEARTKRQEAVFGSPGVEYDAVIDEAAVRLFLVRPQTMSGQLRHLITLAETSSRISIRVVRLSTRRVTVLPPKAPFMLYTFPDPADPSMAIESSVSADHVHIDPSTVARYAGRYDAVRDEAQSEADTVSFLADLDEEIRLMRGPG